MRHFKYLISAFLITLTTGLFADAVADVSCDDSLSGTKEEVHRYMWRGRKIVFKLQKSNCPLVTGALGAKITVDGKELRSQVSWNASEDTVLRSRREVQELWDFVQSKITKRTLPERVIYLEIPSAQSTKIPVLQGQ